MSLVKKSTHPHSTDSIPSSVPPAIPTSIRRSIRSHHQPQYLKDYFCGLIHSSHLPVEYHALVSTLTKYTEPRPYEEASKELEWVAAMEKEIDALMLNQTWEYADLPPRKRALSKKWVYKVKLEPNGTLERLKARLII